LCALEFSPDGAVIAANTKNHPEKESPAEITMWNPQTGQRLATLHGHQHSICDLAFSRDGRDLISCSYLTTGILQEITEEEIIVWDVVSRTSRVSIRCKAQQYGLPACLAVSSSGKWLVLGNRDGSIKLWDIEGYVRREKPKRN
jgi:WD40 repeat protein